MEKVKYGPTPTSERKFTVTVSLGETTRLPDGSIHSQTVRTWQYPLSADSLWALQSPKPLVLRRIADLLSPIVDGIRHKLLGTLAETICWPGEEGDKCRES